DLYELLDKFNHSARAEPTRHRAGDFVANEVTEDCRMPGMRLNGSAHIFGDLFTCGSFTEELDVFFPRKSHQNAHPRGSATIEEPARRRMINPHNVQARLTHQCQIGIHPFRPADIVSVRIRFKRTVRDPFYEKLLLAFEKELRLGDNSGDCRLCHVEPYSHSERSRGCNAANGVREARLSI